MTDLDQQLRQLIQSAQQHAGTATGQTLIMQLWQDVYRSGKLYRPPKDKIPGMYEDIYDEALAKLMDYTLRNIGAYDPDRGVSVIGWMNMLMERRFIPDAIQRFRHREQKFQRPTLADLDRDIAADPVEAIADSPPTQLPSELILCCLREDAGDRFKRACIPKYPAINFQQIALLHHADGYTMTEIAKQLQIPYTSLVSFYQRRLEQFAPIIRAYCLGE